MVWGPEGHRGISSINAEEGVPPKAGEAFSAENRINSPWAGSLEEEERGGGGGGLVRGCQCIPGHRR